MKLLIKYLILILCFLQYYCTEDNPGSSTKQSIGTLFIKSQPPDARIYLLGTDTGKNTPDSIENLQPGVYDGFLYLQYYDTAYFTARVYDNVTSTEEITLQDALPFIDLLWDYVKYYGGDSVKFNYTLNQDIFLDSIIVDRPVDSSGSYTRNIYFYNKQLLDWKDQSGNLLKYYLPPSSNEIQYFPVIEDWDYWLAVYGQKAYGAKTDFYVLTSIKF